MADMPYGETLYSEAPDFRPDAIDPNLYPYRTDAGNDDLPWYRPRPGEFPPWHSHHLVTGELVKVDDHGRSGRFRADRTGELVDFTMPPYGSVTYLDAEADLEDVPPGTRCRFYLHPDDRGAFTRATVITDVFHPLANDRLSYRLVEKPGSGMILVALQHALVKNEKEEMVRPPDYGQACFEVDARTRVWKGGKPSGMGELSEGDELLLNTTGQAVKSRGACTEIWAGADSQGLATGRQLARYRDRLKERGLPAWVDAVEGNQLVITFFSGDRKGFPATLGGDPGGDGVSILLADEELRPVNGAAVRLKYLGHLRDRGPAGTFGCSGVSWRLEAAGPVNGLRPGRVVRVFKGAPPGRALAPAVATPREGE